MRKFRFFLVLLFLCFDQHAASAVVIPPATASISENVCCGQSTGQFSGTLSSPSSVQVMSLNLNGFATGFVGLGAQSPTLPSQLSLATPFGNFSSSAPLVLAMDYGRAGGCGIYSCANSSASLIYYMEVLAPKNSEISSVPIQIAASVGAQLQYPNGATGPSAFQGAAADLSVMGGGISISSSACASGGDSLGWDCAARFGDYKTTDQTSQVKVGQLVTVQLVASTGEYGGSGEGAYADPTFQIDPTFLSENPGFSLLFSADVVQGVPEPSTWAMMIFGFCGFGFVAYRRKRVALRYA